MKNISYPPKPWRNGQRATLINGLEFVYSSSIKNWVPVSPGFKDNTPVEGVSGSTTVGEISAKLNQVDNVLDTVDTALSKVDTALLQIADELASSVKISRSETPPVSPKENDIWVDSQSGRSFAYNAEFDTWIEN